MRILVISQETKQDQEHYAAKDDSFNETPTVDMVCYRPLKYTYSLLLSFNVQPKTHIQEAPMQL